HTVRCSANNENVARTAQTFQDLAVQAKVQTNLRVCRSTHASMGLVNSHQVAKGDVLMRVPTTAAFVLDYDSGLRLPASARWPRLRGSAAGSSEPLPWDILQALALVDGLAGDGGEFWHRYCDELLPTPEQLTLPMCWGEARLAQLQHADIAQAAAAQQARLTALFPELMEPLAPDVPSWLQWAFACVRSRAFRVGADAFAFIPFLDFANHADGPTNDQRPPTVNGTPCRPTANADFCMTPTTSNDDERGEGGGSFFELVALRDITPGEEVTICYSGPEGYTNQRYMAQYGFVPRGGNPADRIRLELDAEHQAAPLELARLQDLMGDALFLAALRGTDPYVFAALKSMPLKDDDPRVMDASSIHRPTAARENDASVRTAMSLLHQVEAQIAEGTTPLEDDEVMLAGPAGEQLLFEDPRLAAAVAYRIERKRLLGTAAALLRAYARGNAR
ncbi:hypothetical protein Vretimale_13795, partial [Volvox reticuliferus]